MDTEISITRPLPDKKYRGPGEFELFDGTGLREEDGDEPIWELYPTRFWDLLQIYCVEDDDGKVYFRALLCLDNEHTEVVFFESQLDLLEFIREIKPSLDAIKEADDRNTEKEDRENYELWKNKSGRVSDVEPKRALRFAKLGFRPFAPENRMEDLMVQIIRKLGSLVEAGYEIGSVINQKDMGGSPVETMGFETEMAIQGTNEKLGELVRHADGTRRTMDTIANVGGFSQIAEAANVATDEKIDAAKRLERAKRAADKVAKAERDAKESARIAAVRKEMGSDG